MNYKYKITIDSDSKKEYPELLSELCTDMQIDMEKALKRCKIAGKITHTSIIKFCQQNDLVCRIDGKEGTTTVLYSIPKEVDVKQINESEAFED